MPTAQLESAVPTYEAMPAKPFALRTVRLSTFGEMSALLESTALLLRDMGYEASAIFGARLALEEAICNGIKHGHHQDATKLVEVRLNIGIDYFLAEVEDEGPGFDPSSVPDPTKMENLGRAGGRGLLLIHHYASWARHNAKGNCITFCIGHLDPTIGLPE